MYCREFKVNGKGEFPKDMLRYDSCWPARPEDVSNLDGTEDRWITLRTYAEGSPTIARWSSFLWAAYDAKRL